MGDGIISCNGNVFGHILEADVSKCTINSDSNNFKIRTVGTGSFTFKLAKETQIKWNKYLRLRYDSMKLYILFNKVKKMRVKKKIAARINRNIWSMMQLGFEV